MDKISFQYIHSANTMKDLVTIEYSEVFFKIFEFRFFENFLFSKYPKMAHKPLLMVSKFVQMCVWMVSEVGCNREKF